MFGIRFHEMLDLPWEQARGFLRDELDALHLSVRTKWGTTFNSDNTLRVEALSSIGGDSTTATRYIANTGVDNVPNWDQVDLEDGVTGRLPLSNIVAATSGTLLGRTTVSNGSYQAIAPGLGVKMSGAVVYGQTQLTPTSDQTLLSGCSVVAVRSYTLTSGMSLTLASGARFRIL